MMHPRKRPHLDIDGGGEQEVVRDLLEVASLAEPTDNCAIAKQRLPAGLRFRWGGAVHQTSHTVLEGHRIAISHIGCGEPLTSWRLPFGVALRHLRPGDYAVNDLMLTALRGRREVSFPLPECANFADTDTSSKSAFVLDRDRFVPGKQVPRDDRPGTWMGYTREGGRGAGTRNMVVILGLTVHCAGFVREAEAAMRRWWEGAKEAFPSVDGVCGVAHNEGGAAVQNNQELLMRALAGFMVHCNVGGVVVVAAGRDEQAVTLSGFQDYLANNGYPVHTVPHRYLTLTEDWSADMDKASRAVAELAGEAAKTARTPQPMSSLCIAQQCGGSDAFSGLTGNPLVGHVSARLVAQGGSAIIAETPELVGAESYVLSNCRSLEVADRFLAISKRYMEYAERHGQNASGNPSGGNLFRGLYNIVLKSLGASRKKPEDLCLDGCLDYAERIGEPGYYFMDSPGNDLESIAGQVASGCNVIFFVTGNGAITNFPFVPTLKFVTTTSRFNILSRDMDVNAGELNDGVGMGEMTDRVFRLMLDVAQGVPSKGERAGHWQVSLWRNWAMPEGTALRDLESTPNYPQHDRPSLPLETKGALTGLPPLPTSLPAWRLILPTSLCSSQIARLAAERLGTQYTYLPHTEGCGGGGGPQQETIMARVLVGHLRHPCITKAFILEHGCEKTHNDWFLQRVVETSPPFDPLVEYGWGSVQLDGGIEATCSKVASYFSKSSEGDEVAAPFSLALLAVDPAGAEFLAMLVASVVAMGGTVILPSNSPLLRSPAFTATLLVDDLPGELITPTLAYAQHPSTPGLHIMEVYEVMSPSELVTGMGAARCTAILWWLGRSSPGLRPAHFFIPTIHAGLQEGSGDFTLCNVADAEQGVRRALETISKCVTTGSTCAKAGGCHDFSIPRGMTGISL